MIVTNNAVECLVAGAEMANMDINAVDSTGVEYDAGQGCTEDDHVMRKQLSLNEYQPALEVSELTWHGTFFQYPNLTIMVTDGKSQMMLRPSAWLPSGSVYGQYDFNGINSRDGKRQHIQDLLQ
jgi:hypothetical protein